MLNFNQIMKIVEGKGYLEFSGNYYECVSYENDLYVFQNVNDDSSFGISLSRLFEEGCYYKIK